MTHRPFIALASGFALLFSALPTSGAAQGELVLAANWVPARNMTSAPLQRAIALDFENVRVKQALQEIGRLGRVHIAYGDDVLRSEARVSLAAEGITVRDALVAALAGTGLEAFVSLSGTTVLVRALERQPGSIAGTVRHAGTDAPLPGATVLIVGTRLSAQTDGEGRYAMAGVPAGTVRLRARMLGYTPADTSVVVVEGQETVIDFQLKAQAIELEAVVAVGYGTQRKATLTGAVSAVAGEVLEKVPAVNMSNTLTGRLPGVVTLNTSGEPGYDGASIRIRGDHTLNDNSPLVVIDGVADREGGLERLNPEDIESISVLKDATAAIYGARAANGVILITTKRGRGAAPQLTARFNQGFNQPTRSPKMADAATYMTMLNEIDLYRNQPLRYSAEEIQKTRTGADPWLYPNTDWFTEVIKPVSLQTVGHMALRGGADRIGYYLSLGALTEDGYYRNSATRYNQYSFRSNIDGRVSDNLNLRFDVTGRLEDRNFPTRSAGSIFWMLMRGKPNDHAYWPNGLPGPDIEYGDNPVVITTPATGYDRDKRYYLQGTLGVDFDVPWVSGLKLRGNAAYDQRFGNAKRWRTPWTLYDWDRVTRDANGQPVLQPALRGFSAPELDESYDRGTDILLNLVAQYRRDFGPHGLAILGGVERQTSNGAFLGAFRKNFLSDEVDHIFAGSDAEKDNRGSASVAARLNYFTRINYDFEDKYLLEFVGRYDGSYIFPEKKRFGFFPAISAGWRISEEPFFRDRVPIFDELKLRASWGRTGNDRIEEWQYKGSYGFGGGDVFGVDREVKGIYQTRTPNPNVTWEVANQLDIGIEGGLLDNRLSFVFDVFNERRTNILHYRNASVPVTTGLSLPRENIGEVKSWGFDGSITWREQRTRDVSYNVTLNFGYAQNRIDFWDEAPGAPAWQRSTGSRMNTDLYYRAIGVFKDQAAVDAYAHLPGARPGDIIFEDVNRDGEITGDDLVRINANGDPTFTGGVTLGAQVKSFDVTAFFQGAAGAVQYLQTNSGESGNFLEELARNRWTPENPSDKYPRASNYDEYWIRNANTYFLRDADYIRLKSLEIGYRVPARLASALRVRDLRIYANGFNLLTWDKFAMFDPEARSGSGAYYPQQRVFNLGAAVTF
jgi:TonB-linked SusC/RagA family outer membrane protein